MFDLIMSIDRRMKYLDGALPLKESPHSEMSHEERAERTGNLLPLLAYKCAEQAGNSGEIICEPPARNAEMINHPSDRQRLLIIMDLLNIGEQRRLRAKGPFVYVFIGKKVYRQDGEGKRVLQVDGDRVKWREAATMPGGLSIQWR